MTEVEPELLQVLRGLAIGELDWPLYLFGKAGTGKTCASLALCDIVETAWYSDVESLCDQVMDLDCIDAYVKVHHKALTVLDEIGTRVRAGDLIYTTIKKFADIREQYQNRVAIYISNLDPSALQNWPGCDDRLASRLLCGTCYELKGYDRRMQ